MTTALRLRLASLFLVIALLAAGTPAAVAGRIGSRTGVSKGQVLHRPNYKSYKSSHNRWFFQRL